MGGPRRAGSSRISKATVEELLRLRESQHREQYRLAAKLVLHRILEGAVPAADVALEDLNKALSDPDQGPRD